jgi:cbb3-type cytochrome oxidase subunit 3
VRRITGPAAALAVALFAAPLAPPPAWAAAHQLASTSHKRVVNATFGAAPSSPVGVDGRSFFTFDTTPGGIGTDHLAVINYSHVPEQLQIYTVDAVSATNGTISFPGQSAPRRQAGAWMAVGTPDRSGAIIIKPRSTDIVPVHLQVPANASPGDHVGAIVVSLTGLVSGKFGHGGVQKVKFDQRIAVRAVVTVSGPSHPLLQVQQLKATYDGPIDPFARGEVRVRYTVHNGGNVVLGGPQSVTVSGLFGEHAKASRVVAVPPLLPGASYPVSVTVPSVYPEVLMSSKVTITTQALQGDVVTGLHPVTSSVHFLAIPWILLVVLLLLILGLAWTYWRRRRRRRSEKAGRHRLPESPAPALVTTPSAPEATETTLP